MIFMDKISTIKQLNAEVAELLGMERKTFRFIPDWNAIKTYGQCGFDENGWYIKISKYLTKDAEIINTMLHELCHLYDENRSGHGHSWKCIAAKIGAHYNTCISVTDEKEVSEAALGKAVAKVICNGCGIETYLYRRTKAYKTECRNYHCTNCGGSFTFIKLK